jgi:L-ascorbate metabolism protein UlaG (beta-lactamase superfamily)
MKTLGARARGLRLERMQASPRWNGNGFRNVHPIDPALRDSAVPFPSMREFMRTGPPRYPDSPLPVVDPRSAWLKPPVSGLRVTWLGHSTLLIEIDGVRMLTDPVWGDRVSPFAMLGPKRFQPAPVRLRDMPRVDALLISHDHYDHLDYPTIRTLARHSSVPMITSLSVGAHLEAWGVGPERITELDWWESHRLPGTGIVVTAAPSQHFSGRGVGDRNATLWSSFAIRSPDHAVFFSGDTGLTTEYATIGERLGPFDVAMIEIGAWHPAWGDIHLGPTNGAQAHAWLGSGKLLPIHWGTFSLATHAWDEPAEALVAIAERRSTPLLLPRLGEPLEPEYAPPAHPWWRAAHASAPVVASATGDDAAASRLPDIPMPLD